MALNVAAGLSWLHAHRIVHFDMKSQNILLARDGVAKISDVGLARILHQDYVTSLDSTGTFAWAAPELLLGRRCTEKVITSLVCVFHGNPHPATPKPLQLTSTRLPSRDVFRGNRRAFLDIAHAQARLHLWCVLTGSAHP